ncbi:MAG TPA: hypothetical protein VK936_01775, partial [Longimicrobiales bacterium]|nr:hypothetical protein [Longimicrobiales bacterium]
CGRPVAATAVGGIPEQVRGHEGAWPAAHATVETADATGLLVPPGDAAALGRATARLLGDADLRLRLGSNAARDARQRFDARRQADTYLEWYRTIIERRGPPQARAAYAADPDAARGRS